MFLREIPPQTLMEIPDGVEGVRETLKKMSKLVKAGKVNDQIRFKAAELVRFLPQKHWRMEIETLWRFVRDDIRYVRDIRNVETLHFAEQVLRQGYGDCDDKAVLLASMLEAIGHPTRFVAVGFAPGKFSHVYVEALLGKRWVPLETTEPVPMGWRPPNIKAVMIETI